VAASCTTDVAISGCRLLIKAALVQLPALTIVSLDDDQAFLVFKSQWKQPNGGLQLTFSASGTGSEIRARSQAPYAGAATPGAAEIRGLFNAIRSALLEMHS
jgi:hypothetical protein